MLRTFLAGVLLAFFWSGGMTKGQADELVIGVVDITPYIIHDSAGTRGIIGDTTKEISRQSGHDITLVVLPWARALEWAKAGKIDAITPVFKTREREGFLHFPAVPLLSMDFVLMAKNNRRLGQITLENSFGSSMLKVRKVSLGPRFDKLAANGKFDIIGANSTTAAVKMLAAGRADLFATQKIVATYAAKRAGLTDKLAVIGEPFGRGYAYLAFSKNSPNNSAKKAVFQSLQSLYLDGYVREVEARYLSYEHVNITHIP